MSKNKTVGLKPKDRKMTVKPQEGKQLTANQWQATPQQNLFMALWLEPTSDTFGNAYQSAIQAGYSNTYAIQLSSPAVGNKWIQEYAKGTIMDTEHIRNAIQDVYRNPKVFNNAKSPADTRLKALELLAKITHLIDNKNTTNVTVVQPILGGASMTHKHSDNDKIIDIDNDGIMDSSR